MIKAQVKGLADANYPHRAKFLLVQMSVNVNTVLMSKCVHPSESKSAFADNNMISFNLSTGYVREGAVYQVAPF